MGDVVENMGIWGRNQSIDSKYCKSAKLNGQNITTYSFQAVVMMATQEFGPIGKGWGYDIIEEKNEEGAIISHKEVLPGENGQLMEKPEIRAVLHTLLVQLWYVQDGKRYTVPTQAGHTPKVMATKYGAKYDEEYYKKTLADAIKKGLSMLGFVAEIYLGLLDDRHYLQMKEEEDSIRRQAESAGRIEKLKERVLSYCEAYAYNTLPQSIKAQLDGHVAEINRECRSLNINSTSFIDKLTAAAEARREQLKQKKQG